MRKFRKKPVVIEAIQWDGTNALGQLKDMLAVTLQNCIAKLGPIPDELGVREALSGEDMTKIMTIGLILEDCMKSNSYRSLEKCAVEKEEMTLDEIEKLCEGLSEGPWKHDAGNWQVEGPRPRRRAICNLNGLDDVDGHDINPNFADAQFIAASRTLMPKLLAVAKAAKEFDHSNRCCGFGCTCWTLKEALKELEKE